MNYLDKEKLLEDLRKNQMFRDALKLAKTDAERQRIIATTSEFLILFSKNLQPIAEKASNDSEFAEQLREAIKSNIDVFTVDKKNT